MHPLEGIPQVYKPHLFLEPITFLNEIPFEYTSIC